MSFDPTKFPTDEYVKQIVQASNGEDPEKVQILLEEYGAKSYAQARYDAADELSAMLRRS